MTAKAWNDFESMLLNKELELGPAMRERMETRADFMGVELAEDSAAAVRALLWVAAHSEVLAKALQNGSAEARWTGRADGGSLYDLRRYVFRFKQGA